MAKIGKREGYHMVPKLVRTKKVIKVGEISEKDDILTVEENGYSLLEIRLKKHWN